MVRLDPACKESQKGFRLLAVRILPECAPYIRKCLAENEFYYLNNDYKISEDGNLIERRSEFVPPIHDDFFQTGEENTPRINISAIVGKNGDGKSTIVEVIIRLLNNFAFDYGIGEKNSLKKAEGLCAELYYQLDGTFYRLEEKKEDENRTVNLCRYENDKTDGRLRLSSQPLAVEEIKDSFFYTLVTNYSHYAYNSLEVEHGNDEEHWLYRIFHKNDGYQVPLTLYPYREEGIMDLINETWSSKQRVLMTFVQSDARLDFNGKKAAELVLTDVGFSKLQEVTLKRFFQENRGVRLLQKQIDFLRHPHEVLGGKQTIQNIVDSLENSSFELIDGFRLNPLLFIKGVKWITENALSDRNSDLQELLDLLMKSYDSIPPEVVSLVNSWIQFSSLYWIQIQRLMLLEKILTLWRIEGIKTKNGTIKIDVSPDLIFKPYLELTNEEKCLHYMIYKTISIFETYRSYGNPCEQYSKEAFFFNGKRPEWKTKNSGTDGLLTDAFLKLARDWDEKSHITLKLRQAYNYYKDKNGLLQSIYSNNSNLQDDNKIHIEFDKLSTFQKQVFSDIETLPPAIFFWDIVFSSKQNEQIPMETFSSGEKQKLYSQSAVVYHLQNISSISHGLTFHYHSVSIILEEIELYFHPDWQRTFCNDLMEMIRSANVKNIDSVNITFVTHSPYILSDIPKTNVLFLKDGRPDYSMQENTFGANINTLLKNGFFLPSLPIGEFAHQKINSMFAKLQSGEFDKTMIDELQSEVMMVGEPYIRQQLMTLLKMYMGIDKNLVMECIRELYLEQRKHD